MNEGSRRGIKMEQAVPLIGELLQICGAAQETANAVVPIMVELIETSVINFTTPQAEALFCKSMEALIAMADGIGPRVKSAVEGNSDALDDSFTVLFEHEGMPQ